MAQETAIQTNPPKRLRVTTLERWSRVIYLTEEDQKEFDDNPEGFMNEYVDGDDFVTVTEIEDVSEYKGGAFSGF